MTSTTCGNRKLSKVKKRQQHLPTENFAPDRQNHADKSSGKATDFLAGRISKSFWITVCHLLVGGWALALWKIWNSVGMMTFPIYGKIRNVPNHQPAYILPILLLTEHYHLDLRHPVAKIPNAWCAPSASLALSACRVSGQIRKCWPAWRNHWILSTNHLPQWKKYSPPKKKAEMYWMYSFWAAFWDYEWGTGSPYWAVATLVNKQTVKRECQIINRRFTNICWDI